MSQTCLLSAAHSRPAEQLLQGAQDSADTHSSSLAHSHLPTLSLTTAPTVWNIWKSHQTHFVKLMSVEGANGYRCFNDPFSHRSRQIGRSTESMIDFVVTDTAGSGQGGGAAGEGSGGGQSTQSTISRYACRIMCERSAPYTARIYAAGFDSSKNIFLGVSVLHISAGNCGGHAESSSSRDRPHLPQLMS